MNQATPPDDESLGQKGFMQSFSILSAYSKYKKKKRS